MLAEQLNNKNIELETLYYSGKLGVSYKKNETTIRVWSPTAKTVDLILFEDYYKPEKERLVMAKGLNGVFEITLTGDYNETAYLFGITFDNAYLETVDPYATATTINGTRSVILPTNENKKDRMPEFKSTDAVIYEMSIRDFSIANKKVSHKGKFLGVLESGNLDGKTTGLDYLKELGVTHVQIMPMYDFYTVDETRPLDSYNWGYDPANYNVPEGSYSTDPYNPKTRIEELKTMINTLHENGIRVIMDVVYNHVYSREFHALEKTVPNYYFRTYEDGRVSNGTGCGNDLASENPMARKYIVDSVKYWVNEYNLDGFRFDLMGCLDIDTMLEVRSEMDKIDPSIIVLGEGWDLNTALPFHKKSIQKNAYHLEGIGHYNDALREALKGSDFGSGADAGFVSGKPMLEGWVATNMMGSAYYPTNRGSYTSPEQMINYVEAHDNLTLYDKLLVTNPWDDENTRTRRHLLATSVILLSQGIPILHAGQEFLRTKGGDENSYKSSDKVNHMDWSRRVEKADCVDYVAGLIKLRKANKLFHLPTVKSIKKHMNILKADYQIIVYQVEDDNYLYYVIFNGQQNSIDFQVEYGEYEILLNDCKVLTIPEKEKLSNVKVPWLSTTIIRKAK